MLVAESGYSETGPTRDDPMSPEESGYRNSKTASSAPGYSIARISE